MWWSFESRYLLPTRKALEVVRMSPPTANKTSSCTRLWSSPTNFGKRLLNLPKYLRPSLTKSGDILFEYFYWPAMCAPAPYRFRQKVWAPEIRDTRVQTFVVWISHKNRVIRSRDVRIDRHCWRQFQFWMAIPPKVPKTIRLWFWWSSPAPDEQSPLLTWPCRG